jgi:transposase
MRPEGSAAELERRRRRAVALLDEGLSQAEVARWVGSSESSVHRWRRMARAGPRGLAARPHPGRQRRLTPGQHRKLERLLVKGARAHGWPNDLWTAGRVTVVIRRHFDVSFHVEHVRKIVKQRLGWTSQKPVRRARQRDELEIERWKRQELPRIKKRR